MTEFECWLEHAPYAFTKEQKHKYLMQRLQKLTQHHQMNCDPYNNILQGLSCEVRELKKLDELPFLPVSLFKTLQLQSVAEDEVVKVLTSSGTSGQSVSRIYLDKMTAAYQQKALVRIVSNFTGSGRLPMLIIDTPTVMKDRNMFSARGAGILGFSMFGSNRCWALTESMTLDFNGVNDFLTRHKGKPVLIFGFTFMVWQHFYQALKSTGRTFDLSNGILIHGGGWKKLQSQAVSVDIFASELHNVSGLVKIHDYYGMVEQTGCIYMQCQEGHLHASIFSDIIIRDPLDLSSCPPGKPGIIQVLSTIPQSYPGHSLLTEDEGVLLGEDNCQCGRLGKYFRIIGRLKNAEIRGCSDTYAAEF